MGAEKQALLFHSTIMNLLEIFSGAIADCVRASAYPLK